MIINWLSLEMLENREFVIYRFKWIKSLRVGKVFKGYWIIMVEEMRGIGFRCYLFKVILFISGRVGFRIRVLIFFFKFC